MKNLALLALVCTLTDTSKLLLGQKTVGKGSTPNHSATEVGVLVPQLSVAQRNATPHFDENATTIENASEKDQFSFSHFFPFDSIIQVGNEYDVIREKPCPPSRARVGTSEEQFVLPILLCPSYSHLLNRRSERNAD